MRKQGSRKLVPESQPKPDNTCIGASDMQTGRRTRREGGPVGFIPLALRAGQRLRDCLRAL